MITAQSSTVVAVLPGNKLIVVGGHAAFNSESDTVEIATLQECTQNLHVACVDLPSS